MMANLWGLFTRKPDIPAADEYGPTSRTSDKAVNPPLPTADLKWPEDAGRPRVGDIAYAPIDWHLDETNQANAQLIRLVILSVVHRTGSTLLQRICNARRGTLIWGEHGGLLRFYTHIYASAAFFSISGGSERQDYFDHQEDPNRWIANMTPELEYVQQATIESARAFLNTLYGRSRDSHDMIGFKEVSYGRSGLELIRRCYPEAAIFLLTRHPIDTWNSTTRQWYPSIEAWIERWNRNTRDFLEVARTIPNCHFLRFEDMVRQEKQAMKLLTDVAQVTPEQIAMVLAKKIGSKSFGVSESERQLIIDNCGSTMKTIGYS